MTDIELAYIAGIMDGEGSISIINRKANGYLLTIQVSMKHPSKTVSWLHGIIGGNFGTYKMSGNAYGHGLQDKWAIHGFDAMDLLRLVKPYIIEKRKVVELALEFPMVGKGHCISDDDTEARSAICDLIRELNSKS